jgi:hypothetical protein
MWAYAYGDGVVGFEVLLDMMSFECGDGFAPGTEDSRRRERDFWVEDVQ